MLVGLFVSLKVESFELGLHFSRVTEGGSDELRN